MIVKVCGLRDSTNVAQVVQAGASRIGFIFFEKSSRNVVNVPHVSSHVPRVGVFVDAPVETVVLKYQEFGLSFVQLHGNESVHYIKELRAALPHVKVTKAISVACDDDIDRYLMYEGLVDEFLFDTKCDTVGGSGRQFDWSVLKRYKGSTPFLLSGGIGPDDAHIVKAFNHPRCIGIDINSKFETAPALKDAQAITKFINEINNDTRDMNRINQLFSTRGDKKLLSLYFCAGYPTLDGTGDVIKAMQEHGISMVEVGFPFSDPMADGPVIQNAATKALANGMTIQKLFDQLEAIKHDVHIPLVLMGYLNVVMQYGIEEFCASCVKSGVSGVIIPDQPFKDYLEQVKPIADRYDLRIIMLITPETSEERVRFIDQHTDGFIYMVSSASTTGAQKSFDEAKQDYFRRINAMNLNNPRMIGFGISNKQTLESAQANAAGAIIGSKFVTLQGETSTPHEALSRLMDALKK